MYAMLKHTHLLIVALSFIVFVIRGFLMMSGSALNQHKIFKIVPHIFYTLLIVSGIALALNLHLSPGNEPWLLVKIIALVVFIILSVLAFKLKNSTLRKVMWFDALIVLIFIISVAFSKNVLGFLAHFF
jgi:uncharacterized membrane protein SirB2